MTTAGVRLWCTCEGKRVTGGGVTDGGLETAGALAAELTGAPEIKAGRLSSGEVLLALQLLGGTIRVLGFRDFTGALYIKGDNVTTVLGVGVGVVSAVGNDEIVDLADDVTVLVEGTSGVEIVITESDDEETVVLDIMGVACILPVGGACDTKHNEVGSLCVVGGASETVVDVASVVLDSTIPEVGEL